MPTTMINARELSKRPADVLKRARKSGAVVITQNGQPAGVMFPVSARGLEADVDLIRRVRFAQAYSFKYSSRPGTPASSLDDQVPEYVKTRRLAELMGGGKEFLKMMKSRCTGCRLLQRKTAPKLFAR